MPTLQIVVASTRPGRKGPAIAAWFHQLARAHGGFEAQLVDLAEVNLPLLDEPAHPRLRQYAHEHTKRWSALVDSADAFVLVMPEYNFGVPAPLVNALDYLYHEWAYKPVGFLSYGGQSGGLRAAQMTKLLVTALRMMPVPETVAVPFFNQHFDEAGAFRGTDAMTKAAHAMLDELRRWSDALLPLRRPADARAAAEPTKPKPGAPRLPGADRSIAASGATSPRR
jgi:NAD(P)H-dependent FMN reductase